MQQYVNKLNHFTKRLVLIIKIPTSHFSRFFRFRPMNHVVYNYIIASEKHRCVLKTYHDLAWFVNSQNRNQYL